MLIKLNRLAVLAVAIAAATASVMTIAQSTAPSDRKPTLRAVLPSARLATEAPMNRLIIKFKDQAMDKSGTLSAAVAEGQVKSLATAGSLALAGKGVNLTYLRSITPESHVALTDEKLSRSDLSAVVRQIARDPRVEYAEIDEKMYPHFVPNDTFFYTQWNLQDPALVSSDPIPGAANLTSAWDRLTTGFVPVSGAGVVVAVLDTGYVQHADLNANIVGGYDFIREDSAGVYTTSNDGSSRDPDASDPGDWNANATAGCPVSDSSWHGTHVAGIVAAVGSNVVGLSGAAYGARVLPVRVLGVCGGYTSDIADGMRWAAGLAVSGVSPNNPNIAKVINLSLGSSSTCSNTFQQAVNAVRAAGSVVIASTGNDAALSIGQPANCNGVIAVTAHTKLGDNAEYADVGAGTAISAPGGGYGSAILGDGSRFASTSNTGLTSPGASPGADTYIGEVGTSFAAPHVAAVAALLFQVKPGITPDEVLSVLTNSARPHPVGTYCYNSPSCGSGLLDADAAVALLQNAVAPTSTASASPANPVPRGSTVNLTGVATAGANAISTSGWTQLSGPVVTLTPINANPATVSFVAANGAATYVFKFTATDTLSRKTENWVTVRTSNTAPVLVAIPAQTVAVGHSLSFTAAAADADFDTVSYAINGLPSGATFNTTTGVFSWSNAQPAGNYTVLIAPTDGAAYGQAQEVNISVTAPAAPASSGGGASDWTDLLALGALALAGAALRRRHAMPD